MTQAIISVLIVLVFGYIGGPWYSIEDVSIVDDLLNTLDDAAFEMSEPE